MRLAPDARLPDGSVYEGEVVDGLFEGQGTLRYDDQEYYQGNFENGRFEGKGELASNKWRYVGYFSEGHFEGYGELTTPNGVYKGEFSDDMFNGEGIFTHPDGSSIEGTFKDDVPVHASASAPGESWRYEGEFEDWLWNGQGTYHDEEGGVYEGLFEQGEIVEGSYKREGNTYRGGFSGWSFHGEGEYQSLAGIHYSGEFEYGSFHGQGVLSKANGSRVEGAFEYGRPKGVVTYTKVDEETGKKTIRKGTWYRGDFVEEGEPSPKEVRQQVVQKILDNDSDRLRRAIDAIPAQRPGHQDVYYLIVGGDASDDVFPRDIDVAKRVLQQKYGVGDRGIILLNSRHYERYPLATTTSIAKALRRLGEVMDPDEDLLFVHMASHGGKGGDFALKAPGMLLPDLMPADFRAMLDAADIPRMVMVLSACYSGQWIDSLATDSNVILASARWDRTSFGCGDSSEMTWFTRAVYLDGALALNDISAFSETISSLIEGWEVQEGFENEQRSEPQFHIGDNFSGF
ncbi:hypothetical protein Y5S_02222 [Alcanivorax nanhaiticus]|uniref:MORN repeat-containing protein n=1 Tax=Alcanivorax nanhaiticus TaxID=1177154 RepID=A0A095SIQ9_9GAMM|nr:hypothetical protein Y5S_02222 [Alcanivorax nanhaiticus]